MISTMEEMEDASPNVAWIALQKGRMSNFIESAFGYRWFVLMVMWNEDDRTVIGGICVPQTKCSHVFGFRGYMGCPLSLLTAVVSQLAIA